MPMVAKINNVFETLNKVDVSEHMEKKGQFNYLSWAHAVRELLKVCPTATWEVHLFDKGDGTKQPYMNDSTGCYVQVSVDVDDIIRTQIHPVLDNVNKTNSKKYQKAIETLESICEVNNVWLKENK